MTRIYELFISASPLFRKNYPKHPTVDFKAADSSPSAAAQHASPHEQAGIRLFRTPLEEIIMKRSLFYLLALLLLSSLLLAACAPQATAVPPAATEAPSQPQAPAASAAPAEKTVTIGFTASLTGTLNVESTRQNNGFKLWMDQVNAAGGIKLADGTMVKFNSKFYDDEFNKDRVQELYTKLVTEDNADFLISPYSSGLADASAVIAEQYGKIMITTGAASEGTYQKGYTLVYQSYTPAGNYLAGAVDLLASLDPNAKKIAIVHENDKFSTDVPTRWRPMPRKKVMRSC